MYMNVGLPFLYYFVNRELNDLIVKREHKPQSAFNLLV